MPNYNKLDLFARTFNMPQKTVFSWNKYQPDNYRLFAIVVLENITFIYSFKSNLARHDSKALSKDDKNDAFVSNFIDIYLEIISQKDLKIFNKILSPEEKNMMLESIEDSLTDNIVRKLDIWKYYNGTICRRSIKRRRTYLASLMFILLILVRD